MLLDLVTLPSSALLDSLKVQSDGTTVSVCECVCECVCVCVCVCVSVCVCSIVPLEADPSEGKAVSGDSVTIMLAVQQ